MDLPETLLCALESHCRQAGSSETGGILIGRYSDDLSVAIVNEATAPPSDSRRGRSWFVRGVNGLRDMLGRRWQAKARTYYLGEWHFHPTEHIEPSAEDFAQMVQISQTKGYDCKEPLLIIMGASELGSRPAFRVFVCPADTDPLEVLEAVDGERA